MPRVKDRDGKEKDLCKNCFEMEAGGERYEKKTLKHPHYDGDECDLCNGYLEEGRDG